MVMGWDLEMRWCYELYVEKLQLSNEGRKMSIRSLLRVGGKDIQRVNCVF